MSIKPRTIDDLGIDSSRRYAQDVESLDRRLIEESKWIPDRTAISVVKPHVPNEFDHLFGFTKGILWAAFQAPSTYSDRMGRLFSFQLIPSLGSAEKQEADADKLAALEGVSDKPQSKKKKKQQDAEGEDTEEKERKILVALMDTLTKFDRTLSIINSRRNQYQKG